MANRQRIINFSDLQSANLVVDAVYEGKRGGSIAGEPISKLLGTGNQGGFRYRGSVVPSSLYLVALVSSLEEPEWPDYLDVEKGLFIYYGDNRQPGGELHGTRKKLNIMLRDCFDFLHQEGREKIPPIFVFTKGEKGRDVVFRGLAVPGGEGVPFTEDLVAIWKAVPEGRFQNYKAIFTVLDIPIISREWLDDLKKGSVVTKNCPKVWHEWRKSGIVRPLIARRTRQYRTKKEQMPSSTLNKNIVTIIHKYFQKNPFGFEKCAAALVRMMDSNIIECETTRSWVDGGRDAIGKYRIGNKDNFIYVDFALEAKCYALTTAVKIRSTARLISRLRYRQFGIMVTTSFVHSQAYKEIKEDQHPVIVVCAEDIANILKGAGFGTPRLVKQWLETKFPL